MGNMKLTMFSNPNWATFRNMKVLSPNGQNWQVLKFRNLIKNTPPPLSKFIEKAAKDISSARKK